jgi:cytochrome c oxidase subunit 3
MTLQVSLLILALIAWSLLVTRLQHKPWTQHGVLPASQDALTSSPAKVALWIFLAVVTSFFLLLNSAYLLRMRFATGLQPWMPIDEPPILWVNTVVLTLASLAMLVSKGAAERSDVRKMQIYYLAAGILTVLFLAGQVLAWRQVSLSGSYGAGDPAYAFFVLLTSIHGLHLAGGLVVLARTVTKIWVSPEKLSGVRLDAARQSVQLTSLYWHFLLIVWFALFALLTAT